MSGVRHGLLLAGGRSVRMGRDKAFLPWRGKPLWRWQAELLMSVGVTRWVVSCRREQGLAEAVTAWSEINGMALEVVFDPEDEKGGMLEAIARGIHQVGGRALVLSVDMPQVNAELLERLWREAENFEGGALIEGPNGPEPFPGIYDLEMLPELNGGDALRAGLERGIRAGKAKALRLTEEYGFCLANWNHPKDVIE